MRVTLLAVQVSYLNKQERLLATYITYLTKYVFLGGSRGLVVKVLDSKFKGCEFKTHTGHGSFSKLRQFRLPYFASVYSAVNEYKHSKLLRTIETRSKHWPYKPSWLPKA